MLDLPAMRVSDSRARECGDKGKKSQGRKSQNAVAVCRVGATVGDTRDNRGKWRARSKEGDKERAVARREKTGKGEINPHKGVFSGGQDFWEEVYLGEQSLWGA